MILKNNTEPISEYTVYQYLEYLSGLNKTNYTKLQFERLKHYALDGYNGRLISSSSLEIEKAYMFLQERGYELPEGIDIINMMEQLECS